MKCPVCGSNISRESTQCEVCGSDLARRAQRSRGRGSARLPYDPHMEIDEASIQRSAVSELKETKAAYKEARRNAGKTNTPKVLAFVLVVIIVAGAAAAATWYFTDQNAKAHEADMQVQLDEALARVNAAQDEVASLQAELKEAEDKIAQYEKAIAEEVVQNSANQNESDDDASTRRDGTAADGTSQAGGGTTATTAGTGSANSNKSNEESNGNRA